MTRFMDYKTYMMMKLVGVKSTSIKFKNNVKIFVGTVIA